MNKKTNIMEVSDNNFQEIAETGVALVDFWAPWCMPCRLQGPILEEVASSVGDKAKICKLNVDSNGDSAMKYGVSSIPTLIMLKDGKEAGRFVGVQSRDTLVNALDRLN